MSTLDIKPTTTGVYKHVGAENHAVAFDLYLPPLAASSNGLLTLPTVVYFHPGGLVIGDKSWFPRWLHDRVLSLGYAFLSANYQLLPPGTVHETIQDIQDLFIYLENNVISLGDKGAFRADMKRTAVAGSSAGGYCAYLAAVHCVPKPKAMFTMAAIGGSVFTPHYLTVKTAPFWKGLDLRDPAPHKQFLYPFPGGSKDPISESPQAPDNDRAGLTTVYFQLAVILDHYTGLHEPSLSAKLREILEEKSNPTLNDFEQAIPVSQRYTFPELNVSSAWPPTLSIHGDADTAVLLSESQNMLQLLTEAGVEASLIIAPGQEHLFDMDPDSEAHWGKDFDVVKDFFFKHLGEA